MMVAAPKIARSRNNEIGHFMEQLASLRFDNVFNPYAQSCPIHDRTNAPAIRRRNLAIVLKAALAGGVDTVWVGRDLGYRGGRRTGLALTDEAHLTLHGGLYGFGALSRATRGPAVTERTATIIWDMLAAIGQPVFLWNVFPLHPHEAGNPMSNRSHTRGEREACRGLMLWLLSALGVKRVVAIGRDAQNALMDFDVPSVAVRHPSYGGQAEFVAGVADLYRLPPTSYGGKQMKLQL